MTTDKDLNIVMSDQVMEAMEKDPKLAKALRETFAIMRQAHHAFQSGRYKSFNDAMEAITGERPKPIDPDNPPSYLTEEEKREIAQINRKMTMCTCGHALSFHDGPSTACNQCLCMAFEDVE